jgi:hypothetical protein
MHELNLMSAQPKLAVVILSEAKNLSSVFPPQQRNSSLRSE